MWPCCRCASCSTRTASGCRSRTEPCHRYGSQAAGPPAPGTSREQWRPTFQDFERRDHDFRARYQVHLAATARERGILAKLIKASDLLLAAEDTWAKEIAATTDLET